MYDIANCCGLASKDVKEGRKKKKNFFFFFFKKNFMAPFYGWGSTASRLEPLRRGSLLFTTKFPEFSWYSFYRPREDERLSQPWSHPVVLNTGPLDWESSALTARPRRKERNDTILVSKTIGYRN